MPANASLKVDLNVVVDTKACVEAVDVDAVEEVVEVEAAEAAPEVRYVSLSIL